MEKVVICTEKHNDVDSCEAHDLASFHDSRQQAAYLLKGSVSSCEALTCSDTISLAIRRIIINLANMKVFNYKEKSNSSAVLAITGFVCHLLRQINPYCRWQ